MKKIILATLILGFAAPAVAAKISIVADEWCPYNCTPNTKNEGYIIDVIREIFEKEGHTLSYRTMNWARAIKDTRNNEFTAIVGAYREDAPDFIFPKQIFGISEMCFYVRPDNKWKYSGVESLSGIITGIINDYSYGEELDKHFKTPNSASVISGAVPLQRGLKMLKLGRIDTMIEDSYVFSHFSSQNRKKFGSFVSAGCTGIKEPVYVAFSPKNSKSQEYQRLFSKGLKRLRQSGKLDKILKKYGLKDWLRP